MTIAYSGSSITYPDLSVQNTAPSGFGFKNRIINGAMVIDQRNAGASVTVVSTAYGVDRMSSEASVSSKFSVQQSSVAPNGFVNSLLHTSLAATSVGATDYYMTTHYVEGYNIADLGWGTPTAAPVTVSFWARSSLTGTFGGCINNQGNSRSYPFIYTINAANTLEYKTLTIPGDTSGTWNTTNARGISLRFGLGIGATYSGTAGSWSGSAYFGATGATSVVGTNAATFYITGVQLEKGSTATSFDYRPYGTELQLCQRYFEKTYAIGTAPGTATAAGFFNISAASQGGSAVTAFVKFATAKRAAPTMTGYNATSGASGNWEYSRSGVNSTNAFNADNFSEFSGRVYVNVGAAWTPSDIQGHWTASSEL